MFIVFTEATYLMTDEPLYAQCVMPSIYIYIYIYMIVYNIAQLIE